jgi:hypothetical protein
MALKKSQYNLFDRLNSQDNRILAIDCELRSTCLWVGLLCLQGNFRYAIDLTTTVDLLDRDNNFIAKVQLDPEFQGDKNGYLPNVSLKIL